MTHGPHEQSNRVTRPTIRSAHGIALGLAASLMSVGPALAQAPKPPTASGSETAPVILTYFVLVLLAGVVVAASLLPSKRGHQD